MQHFLKILAILFCGLFWTSYAFADDPPKTEKTEKTENQNKNKNEPRRFVITRARDRKNEEDEGDDDDLLAKARKDRENADKSQNDGRRIEQAITFNLSVDEFVKTHKDFLPSEIEGILKAAHKETYDSAEAKANALKSAIIQSYFSVQANVDALTPAQKRSLDDYLKLTKNGKEQKAPDIYDTVFEPALETFKRVKKAEELARSRSGITTGSEADAAYKQKLMKSSKRAYLNEKEA